VSKSSTNPHPLILGEVDSIKDVRRVALQSMIDLINTQLAASKFNHRCLRLKCEPPVFSVFDVDHGIEVLAFQSSSLARGSAYLAGFKYALDYLNKKERQ